MRLIHIRTILLFLILLPWAAPAWAAPFFSEDFENHLYPNWLGAGTPTCLTVGSPDGVACNYPRISTTIAHGGTHSLWTHYTAQDAQAGTFIDHPFSGTFETWTRWYEYRSTGYTVGPNEHKDFIVKSNQSLDYWKQDYGNVTPSGSTSMGGGGMIINGTVANPYTCPNGHIIPTNDVTCNFPSNKNTATLSTGVWHCIVTQVNLGTIGNADGVIRIWTDGNLVTEYINVPLRTTNDAFFTLTHYAQYGAVGDRYVDDLAVGSTRADVDNCPGTVIDTTPPAVPTGLAIR